MLVKLAFVMQRLKKFLKNFCHDQQRWEKRFLDFMEDTAVYEGGHRAHGGPQSLPLGKTLSGTQHSQTLPQTFLFKICQNIINLKLSLFLNMADDKIIKM